RKLTAEGARGKEFVVIVSGGADVRRKGRKINDLRAGDFLGEIALITGEPRTATVTTTKPSRVLVITAQAFRMLLRDVPSLQLKVLDALAERVPQD
ncbi:MAG TPA: cyclic nucleotide-binding domain-containing protein, partial [Gaiellaceae bacterium]|nr:cyclic nucleotide-binding domain-containing protein [Gaiellaceae bacterium]